jgi:ABC-type nitrate/sulfonate/bicarbonate transport system substrate-binding protein
LAGKRIGAGSFGTLPAYEVRVLIDKYRLGANTVIVPLNSTNDRMIGTQRGTIDATVVPAPFGLKAEEMGLDGCCTWGRYYRSPGGVGDDRGKN